MNTEDGMIILYIFIISGIVGVLSIARWMYNNINPN